MLFRWDGSHIAYAGICSPMNCVPNSRIIFCSQIQVKVSIGPGFSNGPPLSQQCEAAADVSAMCWQTTPLMAAADSGHIWVP